MPNKHPPLTCPNCASTFVTKDRRGNTYCDDCRMKVSPNGQKRKMEPTEDFIAVSDEDGPWDILDTELDKIIGLEHAEQ